MNLYRFIFALFASLSAVGLFGQGTIKDIDLSLEYIYTNYTTKDGLPSNEVYCSYQDSKGYIWFGTDRGLVRYDGLEFKTYTSLDGLTDNVILAINEDKDGNLWYTGLNNAQLGYIDSDMNFHEYKHYKALNEALNSIQHPNIYFNEIYFEENSIYIVNRILGFVKLNLEGVEQVSIKNIEFDYQTETHLFSKNSIQFIYTDPCYNHNVSIKNKLHALNNTEVLFLTDRCSGIWPTWAKSDSVDYIYDGTDLIKIRQKDISHKKLNFKCKVFSISGGGFIFLTNFY